MQKFSFEMTEIEDLIIINPFAMKDDRGSFVKYFEKGIFKENGIDFTPYESFESTSKRGVIRGLHFQTIKPQAKLVRVSYGKIFDVAVDLRKNSPTLGKWCGCELTNENKKAFYIPKGFAHGFLTLSETAIVSYTCEEKYLNEYDNGIIWNDKDINISWPIENLNLIVSNKDKKLQEFSRFLKTVGGFE